jgi:alanine racemase
MHREGILVKNLPVFIKKIKKMNLVIEGVCSHLADADNSTSTKNTEMQLENFSKAIDILKRNRISPKWKHISASAGHMYFNPEKTNLVRAGVILYGINPTYKRPNRLKIKPVLKFVTHVSQIKEVKKGEKVGYNFTYQASGNQKIAILPIGYADGVDRRLSNRGFVQINGAYCKIVGRISMNLTTVKIPKSLQVRVGDEVVVFSDKADDKNSVSSSAKIAKTIPYDILVGINPTIKRVVE